MQISQPDTADQPQRSAFERGISRGLSIVKKLETLLPMEERTVIAIFAIALALLALWPHAAISISSGQFTFFKNAYDEDTYALLANTNFPRLDRTLSFVLFRVLQFASGDSKVFALVAMDVILIPGAFLAAYYLARALFQSTSGRLLFALVLIFSPDLFGLGNAAFFPGPRLTLETWRDLFGTMGSVLVPPSETSFLTLTRTPEPQTVYVVGFLAIGLLVRFVTSGRKRISALSSAALAACQILLVASYSLFSFPVFAAQAYSTLMMLFHKSYHRAIYLGGLVLTSGVFSILGARAITSSEIGFVFASRLPMLTPSFFVSTTLALAVIVLIVFRRIYEPRLMLALCFFGLPVALLNQQVLTGVMISTRDWERVTTLPLLIVAIGLSWPYVFAPIAAKLSGFTRHAIAVIAISIVCVTVINASSRAYDMWLHDNIVSIAAAQVIAATNDPKLDRRIVLDQPGLTPLVRVRLYPKDADFVLDYTEAFMHPIKPGLENGFSASTLSKSLFEYWRWTDVTPDMAEKILRDEATQKSGYYSGFLFNICEYWYPCSDSRAVKSAAVASAIPEVIAAYTVYLQKDKLPPASSTYLVSTRIDAYRNFVPSPFAGVEISGITMRLFRGRG